MRSILSVVLAFGIAGQAVAQDKTKLTVIDESCRVAEFQKCVVQSARGNHQAAQRPAMMQQIFNEGSRWKGEIEMCQYKLSGTACFREIEVPLSRDEIKAMVRDIIDASNATNREAWNEIFKGMLAAGSVKIEPPK